jgi:capsid protein
VWITKSAWRWHSEPLSVSQRGKRRTHDRLRGEKWLASKLTTNDALQSELETLIDRAVDLYRTDVFAASAINGRVDNVIGVGIRPQCRVQAGTRHPDTDNRPKTSARCLSGCSRKWAEAEGWHTKQRMLERCNAIFGESWLHMADDDDPAKPVTLTVQVIHPQRIPLFGYGPLAPTAIRRLGLRLDTKGKPIAAYVTKTLPNDSYGYDLREQEVSLDDLLHCYEEQTLGQLRGVPWLAPAMPKLKDLKDFVYANLIAEQVAACHGAFVTGVTDPVITGRGWPNAEAIWKTWHPEASNIWPTAKASRLATQHDREQHWHHMLSGHCMALRLPCGYPYELLAKQFTNNFSGGRLALIDGRITFKVWQSCLIEQVFRKVWARFIDRAAWCRVFCRLIRSSTKKTETIFCSISGFRRAGRGLIRRRKCRPIFWPLNRA